MSAGIVRVLNAAAELLHVRGQVCKALREGDLAAAQAYLKAEACAVATLRAVQRESKEEI